MGGVDSGVRLSSFLSCLALKLLGLEMAGSDLRWALFVEGSGLVGGICVGVAHDALAGGRDTFFVRVSAEAGIGWRLGL